MAVQTTFPILSTRDPERLEAFYVAALDAGATSVAEPELMPWGERVAQVRDPSGFVLYLGAEAA
ncbi:hypothetical protein [Agrococcus citreus]|uniref:Glyoxalase-like domain-containing protein n=1 Tax=Agrococcus citreus TaxID=84643 RepID=A0ABN1YLC6_9MICO